MPAPTVTSITPTTGIILGGTPCIIAGTNFTGTTAVTFGGTNATSFTAISATSIYAIAPAHAAGVASIAVTNPSGTGTGSNLYTFTAENTTYNVYLWDDCCHIWISENTGGTFVEGATPGSASTPAPDNPGLDPNGFGTLLDPWSDGQMAINDADYNTVVGVDHRYNSNYGIIGISPTQGRNGTWTLVDPEPHAPAFISDPNFNQTYFRCAISANAGTILIATYNAVANPAEDFYPRISRDGGTTWANVTGVTANVSWTACCFGSASSQVMYLQPASSAPHGISPAYIQKSTDWGVTWSPLSAGPSTQTENNEGYVRLRCSADGEVVARLDRNGDFWVSTNGGTSWTNTDLTSMFVNPGPANSGNVADVGITPDGTTIVVILEQRINSANWPFAAISTDSGTSFTNITNNLKYPASTGAPAGGAPGTNHTGCTACNVAPDGLGVIVTFNQYGDTGITEPDGLTGKVMYVNVSTDAGTTFTLCSFDVDEYEALSEVGFFTGIYIASPTRPPTPPSPSAASSKIYMIERMDDRLWDSAEEVWAVDCALELTQPTPSADLSAGSTNGLGAPVSITGLVGGTGYSSSTTATIDDPTGTGAAVTLTIVAGVITAIGFVGGTGYTNPALQFSDPTSQGSGASATVVLDNSVIFVASSSVFAGGDVGKVIRMGGGMATVTTFTSGTQVTGNLTSPITAVIPDTDPPVPAFALSGNWTMTTPVSTITGLNHLAGATVTGLADGEVISPRTVSAAGHVTLDEPASEVVIGLSFLPQLQSLYLDGGQPTMQGRRKKVASVTARLEASGVSTIEVGSNQPDGSTFSPQVNAPTWGLKPYSPMTAVAVAPNQNLPPFGDDTTPLYTGDTQAIPVSGGFQKPGQVALQQTAPLPMNVLALVPSFEGGDQPEESSGSKPKPPEQTGGRR